MKALKIGDEIYRYVFGSGVWNYIVKGVHRYEKTKQYVVECQPCSHGWKCELLITDDNGKLRFSSLVNHSEDDDQSYWHDGSELFRLDKNFARLDMLKKSKSKVISDLREAEDRLAIIKKRKDEIFILADECEKIIKGK